MLTLVAIGCASGEADRATGGDGGSAGSAGAPPGPSSSVSSASTSSSSSSGATTGSGGSGGAGGSDTGSGGMIMGTADYPLESEENGSPLSSNPLAAGTKGFTAQIEPIGDVDMFSVDVPPGSSLRVEISDGMGGCPTNAATAVQIISGALTIAQDTNGGVGNCSLLSPQTYPALGGLAGGTYYVQVENSLVGTIHFYVVDIQVTPPSCGDAIVQVPAGEQCDDGNAISGDGCSATCALESGNYTTEVEPNGSIATANSVTGFDGVIASLMPIGDQDYFSFAVTTPGSSVTLETSDGFGGCPFGFDSIIDLYDANGTLLESDDEGGVDACSLLSPLTDPGAGNLAVGTYYARVTYYLDGDAAPFYVLRTQVTPPGCGDSVVQAGEQCDDGNSVAGDGCSPTCQLEGNFLPETEVNDTYNLANSIDGYAGAVGSISPASDRDYFKFTVAAGKSVTLSTHSLGNAKACPGDTVIHLLRPDGTELTYNDEDPNLPLCSKIDPATDPAAANLPAGTYYVWVQYWDDLDTIPQYELDVKIQ